SSISEHHKCWRRDNEQEASTISLHLLLPNRLVLIADDFSSGTCGPAGESWCIMGKPTVDVSDSQAIELVKSSEARRKHCGRVPCSGDTWSNGHWMLTIEGEVVCESTHPSFLSGLATFFAAFYVFNLEYPEEAACTMEFIQRFSMWRMASGAELFVFFWLSCDPCVHVLI
ncbi:hypothetical protein DNTS_033701, partial [Danionella cerebrum]